MRKTKMALEKISSVSVRTVEGRTVSIARRADNVAFMLEDADGTMTFTAEDLREIVAEFAPKPRQPRGPNKRTTGAQQNGQADESRVSA